MSDWKQDWERLAEDDEVQREVEVGRSSAALAQLVGQRMAQLEMTQAELARRLGITDGALSRKLNAGVDMRLSSVTSILWELGIALHRSFEALADETWSSGDVTVVAGVVPFGPRARAAPVSLDAPTLPDSGLGWAS